VNVTIELHVQVDIFLGINYFVQLVWKQFVMLTSNLFQGVSGISEITGDFELDIMYSEIWLDPRLSFKHLNVCTTNITLKSDFREKMWTPTICIINSKDAAIHK
jgi:hypothetical protein